MALSRAAASDMPISKLKGMISERPLTVTESMQELAEVRAMSVKLNGQFFY